MIDLVLFGIPTLVWDKKWFICLQNHVVKVAKHDNWRKSLLNTRLDDPCVDLVAANSYFSQTVAYLQQHKAEFGDVGCVRGMRLNEVLQSHRCWFMRATIFVKCCLSLSHFWTISCFSGVILRKLNDPDLRVFFPPLHSQTWLWGCVKAAEGWGGQGEFGVKLEDKLQLNLSKMRWSSLLLELLRKDRSVCVCVFVYFYAVFYRCVLRRGAE